MSTTLPDSTGRFGRFGGRYVPETLMFALDELKSAYEEIKNDDDFQNEYIDLLKNYSGRPTPVTFAANLSDHAGGAPIYLKREDLNHTGAHKINNAIGQGLLAKRMGKSKLIAETGAGQHGVATATVASFFGMACDVYMGEKDIERQALNVFRMELLGARVIPVKSGSRTLKDATNEALRQWVTEVRDAYYLIGSVVGPHPYPVMVRDFQKIIGEESRKQMAALAGRLPKVITACVGGGSNAMGMFYPFLDDSVDLFGAEAAGKGIDTDAHAATLSRGRKGVLHGAMSYLIQDEDGQIEEPYSISAGLDYPGIGPEHAYLHETKRVTYEAVTDQEAVEALKLLNRTEGILPALESAHAVALALKKARAYKTDEPILVCLSGRGDKDVHTLKKMMEEEGDA